MDQRHVVGAKHLEVTQYVIQALDNKYNVTFPKCFEFVM